MVSGKRHTAEAEVGSQLHQGGAVQNNAKPVHYRQPGIADALSQAVAGTGDSFQYGRR
jgi:hypothetical protein